LLDAWPDGRVKLFVIHRALAARRAHPNVFTTGAYRPVDVVGTRRDHVVGFARGDDGAALLTIVPRLSVSLTGQRQVLPLGDEVWEDTSILIPGSSADDTWRNLLTGELLRASDLDGRASLRMADVLRT